LVIQNDLGNQYSPIVIVASITLAQPKVRYSTDVGLQPGINNAPYSRIQLNQIGRLTDTQMAQVDEALKISLGLVSL
jgi:mRNA-degrading endonuclease toxin of MazEF toxin-antitoxin module